MLRAVVSALAITALFVFPSRAEISVNLSSSGTTAALVQPGTVLSLDISISSAAGEQFDSAIVRLQFSAPGLWIDAFSWSSPFATGGTFDDSIPSAASLPALITPALLQGPGYPPLTSDIEFSNVTTSGKFQSGILVSMLLRVPLDYSGPPQILVAAIPDGFYSGFAEVAATSGTPFVISVPSPSAATAGFVLWVLTGRRLRKTTCNE